MKRLFLEWDLFRDVEVYVKKPRPLVGTLQSVIDRESLNHLHKPKEGINGKFEK